MKKKLKFKYYEHIDDCDKNKKFDCYLEKNIKVYDDYFYLNIFGDENYYAIDLCFMGMDIQIRDKKIKTRSAAIKRIKKEIKDHFEKYRRSAMSILDSVEV